jgi:hypothetical protein
VEWHLLKLAMDALKVLAEAWVQVGGAMEAFYTRAIRADVEETEAILAAYWEGVLEETRWELGEQRRRVAAVAAVAAEGEAELEKKKSKAAKWKQQKRKAQQRKKAAEMAGGGAMEAAATAMRREADAQGHNEAGRQAPQGEQENEEEEEGEEENKGTVKANSEQTMATAAAALAAMDVSEKKGEEEVEGQEEEEDDECSVCLNAIESNDTKNPAGPPLVCGHRYHAFCLQFWVERCTNKCIEPTCPYCRAPVQEIGNMERSLEYRNAWKRMI